ncbi:uncharacterized protein LOC144437325 [Glandiceps talaboti]
MYSYIRKRRYILVAFAFLFFFACWIWIFVNTGTTSKEPPSGSLMFQENTAPEKTNRADTSETIHMEQNNVDVEGSLTNEDTGGHVIEKYPVKPFKIYVYDLPSKFNRDLARCVQTIDKCFQLDENNFGMGPELLGYKDVSVRDTHQFSLEVILHEKMMYSSYRTKNASEADLYYIPFYPGIACFCRSFQKSSFDLITLHQEMWHYITEKWPYFDMGKPHAMALAKIEREHWSQRCGILSEFDYANEIQFIGIEEEYNPAYRSYFKRSEQHILVAPYPSYGHLLATKHTRSNARTVNFYDPPETTSTNTNRNILVFMAASDRNNHELREILKSQMNWTKETYESYMTSHPSDYEDYTYEGVWYVTPECAHPTKLPTMQWMQHSIFCLQPPGDSPTRKSFYDAIVAGCIPVIFLPEYLNVKYPFQRHINYSEFTLNFGLETFMFEEPDIVEMLRDMPDETVEFLQNNLAKVRRYLQYSYPSSSKSQDAFHMILKELQAVFKF